MNGGLRGRRGSEGGFAWVPLLVKLGLSAVVAVFFAAPDDSFIGEIRGKVGENLWPLVEGLLALAEKYQADFNAMLNAVIPMDWIPAFESLQSYLGFLDYFLCLQFAVTMIMTRYLIICTVGGIRLIKSFIPMISG